MCESTKRIDSLYGCRLLYFDFKGSVQSRKSILYKALRFARSDESFTTGLSSINGIAGRYSFFRRLTGNHLIG
jgi:hypothetical protein